MKDRSIRKMTAKISAVEQVSGESHKTRITRLDSWDILVVFHKFEDSVHMMYLSTISLLDSLVADRL